ncbi:LysE family translocator [Psychrobacter aestuarii]|uniref:LysE family translocator n=1 Tax=Psychrobacter aestuarii TaxID=556327 RepID=A0ABP3FC16_9GAMM|nr:LysE family transporter [Psychrobacter aestuarii]
MICDKAYDSWGLFKQGLLTSSSNPKPILFFMAVFPQFIEAEHAYLPQFLLLALSFCLLVIMIHCCYAALFSLASKYVWKAQDKLSVMTKIGGAVLVLLSIVLIISAGKSILNS